METVADHVWKVLKTAPHPEKELDERRCQEGFSERFRGRLCGLPSMSTPVFMGRQGLASQGCGRPRVLPSVGLPSAGPASHTHNMFCPQRRKGWVSHSCSVPLCQQRVKGAEICTAASIHQSPPQQQFLRTLTSGAAERPDPVTLAQPHGHFILLRTPQSPHTWPEGPC